MPQGRGSEVALDVESSVEDADDDDVAILIDRVGDALVAVEEDAQRLSAAARMTVAALGEVRERQTPLVDAAWKGATHFSWKGATHFSGSPPAIPSRSAAFASTRAAVVASATLKGAPSEAFPATARECRAWFGAAAPPAA